MCYSLLQVCLFIAIAFIFKGMPKLITKKKYMLHGCQISIQNVKKKKKIGI